MIGGPSRSGKSTLAELVVRERLRGSILKGLFPIQKIPIGARDIHLLGKTISADQPISDNPDNSYIKDFDISLSITTLMDSQKNGLLIVLPTDYIRSLIRRIIVGKDVGLGAVTFECKQSFLISNELAAPNEIEVTVPRLDQVPVGQNAEDFVAWKVIVSLLEDYDQENVCDIIVEGVAVTPEEVYGLRLRNLDMKSVFLGYNDYAAYRAMVPFSEAEKQKREVELKTLVAEADRLKQKVEKLNYAYFDMTKTSMDQVVSKLLNS